MAQPDLDIPRVSILDQLVANGGGGGGGTPTGAAGSPNAAVVSVQGVASMTPVKVDGSAVTQPVSVSALPSIVGAANLVTGQWSNATASATQIVAARTGAPGTGRVSVTLYNAGSTTFFYGPSGVTTANGSRLLPGGSRTIKTTAAIFGVPASGTANADFDEVF